MEIFTPTLQIGQLISERDVKSLLQIGWECWALDPSDFKNDAISIVSFCVILTITLLLTD